MTINNRRSSMNMMQSSLIQMLANFEIRRYKIFVAMSHRKMNTPATRMVSRQPYFYSIKSFYLPISSVSMSSFAKLELELSLLTFPSPLAVSSEASQKFDTNSIFVRVSLMRRWGEFSQDMNMLLSDIKLNADERWLAPGLLRLLLLVLLPCSVSS